MSELGYACGVLCARGFIKKGRNNCIGLSTKNKELIDAFAAALRSVCGRDMLVIQKTIAQKTYFTANIYGKHIVEIFGNIGFLPKRKTWSPPDIAYHNHDFRSSFLAGFFDATSVVYFDREKFLVSGNGYRYLRVTSVNLEGLIKIKKLLSLDGVESSLRSRNSLHYLVVKGKWRLVSFINAIALRTQKKTRLRECISASTPSQLPNPTDRPQ
ncbi:MAG: hypothetical protein V1836_00520 [Candidatus Aenigmatarchaeota archaeon]